jgi:aromatic ring-cleaving dioxygenase
MTTIANFHAHIYFDPGQLEEAKALAGGHFHVGPVGPHPRGSCQLTVQPGQWGEFAQWAVVSRRGLTIFAHATTGDDLADHSHNVIWFGPSEPLDLTIFD